MSKLEKLLFKTIDKQICGVDSYTKNKSFWLIFTDDKKWVIEFISNSGNLWYNYLFFENIFTWLGIKDNKNDLIKKWFESRFLGINEIENDIQNKVISTSASPLQKTRFVDNTIQNGVRSNARGSTETLEIMVENTIQNEVRSTQMVRAFRIITVENTIQNGVRSTMSDTANHLGKIENTIQNGVKNTNGTDISQYFYVEDTIQNGVKNTEEVFPFENVPVEDIIQNGIVISRSSGGVSCGRIEDTIQKGVKRTYTSGKSKLGVEETIQNGVRISGARNDSRSLRIKNTIQDGVKNVIELPDNSGQLKGYSEYYRTQEDITKPHVQYVKEVLTNGVKSTSFLKSRFPDDIDNAIKNGKKID